MKELTKNEQQHWQRKAKEFLTHSPIVDTNHSILLFSMPFLLSKRETKKSNP